MCNNIYDINALLQLLIINLDCEVPFHCRMRESSLGKS